MQEIYSSMGMSNNLCHMQAPEMKTFHDFEKAWVINFVSPFWVRDLYLVKKHNRGWYRGILVTRDQLILFSMKREFRKLFFVTCDLKVSCDP